MNKIRVQNNVVAFSEQLWLVYKLRVRAKGENDGNVWGFKGVRMRLGWGGGGGVEGPIEWFLAPASLSLYLILSNLEIVDLEEWKGKLVWRWLELLKSVKVLEPEVWWRSMNWQEGTDEKDILEVESTGLTKCRCIGWRARGMWRCPEVWIWGTRKLVVH